MWPDLELIGVYPSRFSGVYFIAKGVFPSLYSGAGGKKLKGNQRRRSNAFGQISIFRAISKVITVI